MVNAIVRRVAQALEELCGTSESAGWFIMNGVGGEGSLDARGRNETRLGVASEVFVVESGEDSKLSTLVAEHGGGSDWVVVLGYEYGRPESLGAADTPAALAMRVPVYLVVDHETLEVTLVHHADATAAEIERHRHVLEYVAETSREHVSGLVDGRTGSASGRLKWRHSDAEYIGLIDRAQALLDDEGTSVLCLTNRATLNTAHLEALDAFARLTAASDAPYAALIVSAQHTLIAASPERFLSLHDGRIQTSPMKGTRSRSQDPDADARHARELAQDVKELRENRAVTSTVVDKLLTVCEPASVQITADCRVVPFQQVHQLISVVEGTLSPIRSEPTDERASVWRVLDAMYPPPSMTGVPDAIAIPALARLEGGPRGWYSGCYGWISDAGESASLAVTIRSIERHGSTVHVGTGGGITRESVAERELQEMRYKARAPLQAIPAEPAS